MSDGLRAARRFSASEAAFTGFRLLAREPLTWAVWTLAFFAFSLLVGAAMVIAIGPALTQLMQASRPGAADPAATLALMGRVLPAYGLIFLLSIAGYAFMFAAVNRAVLRPGTGGPGRFGLGGDEFRQLLVLVIVGAILFAVYIAAATVAVALSVGIGIAAAGAGAAGGAGAQGLAMAGPAALVMLLVFVLVIGLLLWFMVRLSLASPLTFDTGKVEVFASWRLTRGRFWPILGAYLLAAITMMLIYFVAMVLFAALAMGIGGGLQAAGVMFRPDTTSIATYFTPLTIVWLVIASALGAVWMAVSIGAPAGAYAQLREVDLAATFGGSAPTSTPGATGRVVPDPTLPKFGN